MKTRSRSCISTKDHHHHPNLLNVKESKKGKTLESMKIKPIVEDNFNYKIGRSWKHIQSCRNTGSDVDYDEIMLTHDDASYKVIPSSN